MEFKINLKFKATSRARAKHFLNKILQENEKWARRNCIETSLVEMDGPEALNGQVLRKTAGLELIFETNNRGRVILDREENFAEVPDQKTKLDTPQLELGPPTS